MRSKTFLNHLLRLLIALCFMQAANFYAQSKVSHTYQFRKIFIETVPNIKDLRIDPFLKTELEKRGFEVVNDVSNAEAILSLVSGYEEIASAYDIDDNTPTYATYRFKMTSPSKAIIWKTKLRFVSMSSVVETNEYVARRVAEKIAKKFSMK